ncbi:ribose 5-phosphate isomerase A [Salibacterium salarium]|uniref:ribose-5-phosphate isomerase RpiA n=1 Tax=Salibacterium salarium TaxID=284579 RepID=UPI002784AA90|nr:ribose-5-phosphate isomerase RpiA [Salibacterium salarium]MDQ0297963.1 ribose 5-phosphate isomerase A [Salibacterium salarium]
MVEKNNYNELTTQSDYDKKAAAEKSVDFIKNGMIIGLGSGSTVYWMMKELSQKVEQGLQVKGIPSSKRTENWAIELQIPLTDFHENLTLDLAIDGADEIDPDFNLLKGGGGSLVREKIVNNASKEVVIIGDKPKLVSQLGKIPLPIEIVPFGWEVTANHILSQLDCEPVLRRKDGDIFISDNGNYIVDCSFEHIPNPKALHDQLKNLVGVVETGLYVNLADTVVISEKEHVNVLMARKD